MRKCYIDCTNTIFCNNNTGIQRVVRNIISRCPVQVDDVDFVPVFAYCGKFYRFGSAKRDPLIFTKILDRLIGCIRNYIDLIFASFFANKSLADGRRSVKNETTRLYIINSARKLIPFIFKPIFYIEKNIFNIKKIPIESGDILFLPDVFWDENLIDTLEKNKESNSINIVLIHDIIPILYPQLVDEGHVDSFMQHISYILTWSNGVMSVSQSSLDEIRKYGTLVGEYPAYDYFHLGADFSSCNEPIGPVRPTLSEFFEGSATYLMVGTIEPRKNHQYVLKAFKKLWERGEQVKLCIIGKIDWKCRDIIDEINSLSSRNLSLLMVNDASDAELRYCYTHTKATIIASIAEGFGLPLVEALHMGTMVFASNIPVFREIGNDSPIYFSLDSTDSLVGKIIEFQKSDHFIVKKQTVVPSWDEAVSELFAKVVSMSVAFEVRRQLSELDISHVN